MNKPEFRAWHKILKQMFMVVVIDFYNKEVTLKPYIFGRKKTVDCFLRNISFKDIVLSQYSGLKDDKKMKAFENDTIILKRKKYILKYGDYRDADTRLYKFGWYLESDKLKIEYLGGGEIKD